MGRPPCCEEMGLKKGPWTPEEDNILTSYIQHHGHGNWRALPKLAGLMRCGKSCRLRWINYLRPDIKRGNFTKDEEDTIIKFHHLLGNRWSAIAARLPGRTDNEIKNFWHTNLKKRSTPPTPPTPITPTTTGNVVTNTSFQIIPQQPPEEVDAAKTRCNSLMNQSELLQSCSSSYDEYQQQPMMMFPSTNQQFDKLDHDQNQMDHDDDFWYTLFVKAENPAHHDHDQVLLT